MITRCSSVNSSRSAKSPLQSTPSGANLGTHRLRRAVSASRSMKALFGATRSNAKNSALHKQIGAAEASSIMDGQVSLRFPLSAKRSASAVVSSRLVSNYRWSLRCAQEEGPTAHALRAAPLIALQPLFFDFVSDLQDLIIMICLLTAPAPCLYS